MDLSIEVVENDEKNSIKLSGEIDAYTAPKLKETLLPLTKLEKVNTIEVDFTNVNYMDSTGLGVFVSALKSSNEHGNEFKLVNLNDRIYRIFKITGLIDIMDIQRVTKGGEV
ncbi:anti-sigma factor antagonist [Oceanobacillus piezotolerans]|uniref:Anti-sigma factor antagonist n=1 Tax=Oceanobacillus piezotolerans TaxID=2448030 RepID=A0A498D655_9BACI|nr:STAS domain-containing protein [Oceanobacillus piezotolerans]RLL42145.1 anti-sigma factor antagonist [Oceanobacillus piezotolerans]